MCVEASCLIIWTGCLAWQSCLFVRTWEGIILFNSSFHADFTHPVAFLHCRVIYMSMANVFEGSHSALLRPIENQALPFLKHIFGRQPSMP